MPSRPRLRDIGSVLCFLLFSLAAQSATVTVHCGGSVSGINSALSRLNPIGPNTLIVSGTCKENVVVQGFDRLTLQAAQSGATINDMSGGNNPTVAIVDSQRVAIQGFTINGGSPGILCGDFSLCRFSQNTVQNAADNGVIISGSRSSFDGDTIQNNASRGLVLRQQSSVVIAGAILQGNPDAGADVHDGSFLYSIGTTVQNNGFGLRAEESTLRIELTNISSNSLDGVQLQEESNAWFSTVSGPNMITGSGFQDVSVNDLSFASFDPGNVVTGSLQPPDVVCNPQFSATRGAITNIGGGTTNCQEPGDMVKHGR
ncbi:MAG: right-handed parallel beta-helix repeat-containing protein [Candidatus Korobacteraceae bacterium]